MSCDDNSHHSFESFQLESIENMKKARTITYARGFEILFEVQIDQWE